MESKEKALNFYPPEWTLNKWFKALRIGHNNKRNLRTGTWPIEGAGIAGTQIGLLSVTMIAINNLRDIHGDKKSGKKTLAARFGENFIRSVIGAALFSPYVMGILWWRVAPLATLLPLPALLFAFKIWGGLQATPPSKALNAFLGKASLHLLFFGILLSVALTWK